MGNSSINEPFLMAMLNNQRVIIYIYTEMLVICVVSRKIYRKSEIPIFQWESHESP